MFAFLMILTILVGALMTVIILMQSSKGQGLSGAFGGSSGGVGAMLGVRRASDVLVKATWILATVFGLLIFIINLFFLPTEATEESIIQRSAQEQPLTPAQRQQQMPPQQAPAEQPAPPPTQGQ